VAATAVLWVLSAGFIEGCMHWFKKQPYSIIEPLLPPPFSASEPVFFHIHYMSHKYLAIPLLTLPILIAFAVRYPVKERWARNQAAAVVIALAVGGGLFAAIAHGKVHKAASYLLAPFSDDELSTKGFDLGGFAGTRPNVLPMSVRITLTVLTFAAFFAFLLFLVNAPRRATRPGPENAGQISNRTLLTVLGPFTAGYLGLMVTRAGVSERYFLPFLCLFLLFLLRFYQAKVASRLPVLTGLFVLLFAAYGVVVLHDYLASDRAALEAVNELRAAGVPRTGIRAGYAYDALTQIELTGYVLPKQPWKPIRECVFWWDKYTPVVHGPYLLSYSPSCFPESEFPPVEYTTWLAPHHQKIYILKSPN
jgi:hypothetical protein